MEESSSEALSETSSNGMWSVSYCEEDQNEFYNEMAQRYEAPDGLMESSLFQLGSSVFTEKLEDLKQTKEAETNRGKLRKYWLLFARNYQKLRALRPLFIHFYEDSVGPKYTEMVVRTCFLKWRKGRKKLGGREKWEMINRRWKRKTLKDELHELFRCLEERRAELAAESIVSRRWFREPDYNFLLRHALTPLSEEKGIDNGSEYEEEEEEEEEALEQTAATPEKKPRHVNSNAKRRQERGVSPARKVVESESGFSDAMEDVRKSPPSKPRVSSSTDSEIVDDRQGAPLEETEEKHTEEIATIKKDGDSKKEATVVVEEEDVSEESNHEECPAHVTVTTPTKLSTREALEFLHKNGPKSLSILVVVFIIVNCFLLGFFVPLLFKRLF